MCALGEAWNWVGRPSGEGKLRVEALTHWWVTRFKIRVVAVQIEESQRILLY